MKSCYKSIAVLFLLSACSLNTGIDRTPQSSLQPTATIPVNILTPFTTPTQTAIVTPIVKTATRTQPSFIPSNTSTPEFSTDVGAFTSRFPSGLDWLLASEEVIKELDSLSLILNVKEETYLDGSSYSTIIEVNQDCLLRLPLDSNCKSQTITSFVHFLSREIRTQETQSTETILISPDAWFRIAGRDWEHLPDTVEGLFSVTEEGQEHLLFSQYLTSAELKGTKILDEKTLVGIHFQLDIPEYYLRVFGTGLELSEERINENWLWIDAESLEWHSSYINLIFFQPAENDRQYIVVINSHTEYSDFNVPVDISKP